MGGACTDFTEAGMFAKKPRPHQSSTSCKNIPKTYVVHIYANPRNVNHTNHQTNFTRTSMIPGMYSVPISPAI